MDYCVAKEIFRLRFFSPVQHTRRMEYLFIPLPGASECTSIVWSCKSRVSSVAGCARKIQSKDVCRYKLGRGWLPRGYFGMQQLFQRFKQDFEGAASWPREFFSVQHRTPLVRHSGHVKSACRVVCSGPFRFFILVGRKNFHFLPHLWILGPVVAVSYLTDIVSSTTAYNTTPPVLLLHAKRFLLLSTPTGAADVTLPSPPVAVTLHYAACWASFSLSTNQVCFRASPEGAQAAARERPWRRSEARGGAVLFPRGYG